MEADVAVSNQQNHVAHVVRTSDPGVVISC